MGKRPPAQDQTTYPVFRKVLVANRGEIAVRIIRACRDLNISPVAIYSEADRESLHVRLADEAYEIGPAESTKSYLAMEKVLETARRCGAEAVHPGYGFLAENADFANLCEKGGLRFIGPPHEAIRTMGDKIGSRTAVEKAGVPLIPGTGAFSSLDDALRQVSKTGYPVMLKASAGGGGKGLRVIGDERDLRICFEEARGEAAAAFGDGTLYAERYLERTRHIEIQLLGDHRGNIIHLGERECSIQRRHQKVIEECPSPMTTPELRARMGVAAVAAARAVGYQNAGTVEFLVDTGSDPSQPDFYFLEMNTRLQVEHPVTELVTGLDLVREQILLAAGRTLSCSQEDVEWRGAALEFRIYAEDPYNRFFPSPGTIRSCFEPSGPGVRNDSGVYPGFTIPIHYDPLISKLVTFGSDREEAIARMRRALREYRIEGIRTNIPFFELVLRHPEFLAGNLHTGFIEEHRLLEAMNPHQDENVPQSAVLAAALHHYLEARWKPPAPTSRPRSRWRDAGRLRNPPPRW